MMAIKYNCSSIHCLIKYSARFELYRGESFLTLAIGNIVNTYIQRNQPTYLVPFYSYLVFPDLILMSGI